jgi:CRP-like cAMP-binding protein
MNLPQSAIELIQDSALLRGLDKKEISTIVEAAQIRNTDSGAFFFMEEDEADRAYVLLDGKVKLIQVTTDGQQVILGYLIPGRVYGIIAVLKKVTYPVSAQAVGTCKALVWNQKTLNRLMDQFPRMALNALRIMAGQIREFQNTVKDLSTKRVEQRIARAIIRLARESGKKTEDGVLIDLPLSRQDIAEMTGTTLYTVSRVIKDWEKQNFVKSQRQRIMITFPHGLVTIAEDLPGKQSIDLHIEKDKCDL